ncbi:Uncharacterised protein [Enterobacter roggenkampii]|nr:Uncharacterised protein [Enterobacter roggenkampii]
MGFISSARPIQRTARPAIIMPRTSPPDSTPPSVLAPLATALKPVTSQRSLPPSPSASVSRSQLARSKTAFFQTLTKGEIRRFSPSLRPIVAILKASNAPTTFMVPLTSCGFAAIHLPTLSIKGIKVSPSWIKAGRSDSPMLMAASLNPTCVLRQRASRVSFCFVKSVLNVFLAAGLFISCLLERYLSQP